MRARCLLVGIALNLIFCEFGFSLYIESYNSITNDRFSSGWTTDALVANENPAFLGYGYDLSGIAWNLNKRSQAVAMLSPVNYLGSTHAWTGVTSLQFMSSDGELVTRTTTSNMAAVSNSDISIGTLGAALKPSDNVGFYKLLDLGRENVNAYIGKTVLLYGHGGQTEVFNPTNSPRLASSTLTGGLFITGQYNSSSFSTGTSPNTVYSVGGDSSSPAFLPSVNPITGEKELTILGGRWTSSSNSFLPTITRYADVNYFMSQSGYTLRWTPSTIHETWKGANGGNWGDASNWSSTTPLSSDYILFDATTSSERVISLQASREVLGLYLKGADGLSDGFTFNGSYTLTVGRGGITNLDDSRQNLNVSISASATDPLYIDGGKGGIRIVGNLNNTGRLLSFSTEGSSEIVGNINGNGGFAKDGIGTLTLKAPSFYQGKTFIHAGSLLVNSTSGYGTGYGAVDVEGSASLGGTGAIYGNVLVRDGGRLGVSGQGDMLSLQGGISLNGTFVWELNANSATGAGMNFDQITVNAGNIVFSSTSGLILSFGKNVDFQDPFWNVERTWVLINNVGGGLTSGSLYWVGWHEYVSAGMFSVSSVDGAGGDLILAFTPVPEPAPVMMVLIALGILGFMTRTLRSRPSNV